LIRKRASKAVLFFNLLLIAYIASSFAAITIHTRQEVQQHVTAYAEVTASNFTLPDGIVNMEDAYVANGALVITTHAPDTLVQIQCANFEDLQEQYCTLNLDVSLNGNPGEFLNLLTNDIMQFTIATPGTYAYDYSFSYTPCAEGDNIILLDVTVA
jgi:hypothetical protein